MHDGGALTGGAGADGITMRPHKSAEVLPSLFHGPDWPARVLHGTPALLAYLDAEQRFCYANETHRSWLGIDPQWLIGRRLIDVVGRRNHQLASAALERAYAGQRASYEGELFTFVTEPGVPADNNAAERSLRHLVIQRKISGGTRSPEGTATLMVASTLFGTWQAQGRDPLQACRDLLTQPQV